MNNGPVMRGFKFSLSPGMYWRLLADPANDERIELGRIQQILSKLARWTFIGNGEKVGL